MTNYEVTCEALAYSYTSDENICVLESALEAECSKAAALESYNTLFAIAMEAEEVQEKNVNKIVEKIKEIWKNFKLGVQKFMNAVKERITQAANALKAKTEAMRAKAAEKKLGGKGEVGGAVSARTKYFISTEFDHLTNMLDWIEDPIESSFSKELAEGWVKQFMDGAPEEDKGDVAMIDGNTALKALRSSVADMDSLRKALAVGEKSMNEAIRTAQSNDDAKELKARKADVIAGIDMLMKVYRQRMSAAITVCNAVVKTDREYDKRDAAKAKADQRETGKYNKEKSGAAKAEVRADAARSRAESQRRMAAAKNIAKGVSTK